MPPKRAASVKKEKKPREKKAKVDKGPKRALSAYMFFAQDQRATVKEENPEASFGEIGKLLGEKWKELTDADKKPYEKKHLADKKRYEEEKAEWESSGEKKPTKKGKKAAAEEEEGGDEEEEGEE